MDAPHLPRAGFDHGRCWWSASAGRCTALLDFPGGPGLRQHVPHHGRGAAGDDQVVPGDLPLLAGGAGRFRCCSRPAYAQRTAIGAPAPCPQGLREKLHSRPAGPATDHGCLDSKLRSRRCSRCSRKMRLSAPPPADLRRRDPGGDRARPGVAPFPFLLPAFLGKYPGDALWALMVFCGLAVLFPAARGRRLAAGALAICLCGRAEPALPRALARRHPRHYPRPPGAGLGVCLARPGRLRRGRGARLAARPDLCRPGRGSDGPGPAAPRSGRASAGSRRGRGRRSGRWPSIR